MNKMNCLIFDDHPLVCVAIKSLLKELGMTNEVFTVTSAKSAFKTLKESNIELLILDVNLADCDGFDFYKRIKSHGYEGKVIFFSAETSQMYSQMAFRSGADGYVCKSENHDILKDAIEAVVKGYTFFKFKQVANEVREMPQLSSRESAVMKYLLQGKSNRDIASVLSISDKTVSTYKRRVLDKFNVKNIVELTRVAGT
ncbi:TPA: response regulator transcription factor [Vibrio parahaemolyticus]|uniref:response regulator transcription factor n=1 Tax=Vibrio parahaemolyticus TaxID=670 RepID=UPI0011233BFF|nr:response regulator transcription factor [Vibrio parahaemolyticus]MBE4291734.1 response regulator transcription factor [Vibrio parahaemolyticus]TOJ49956.1 DNA-binding response regulator [Vibrio parahaemolyticus]HCE2386487.1 response regulator transcription factor [Vibrio parahaemolyticus]HCE2670322.1 response regulator transcription factor [Vibrio parahaemolyticus]HCE4614134.1 response regulator transcription factor [Vibrio parahaemolyticus]